MADITTIIGDNIRGFRTKKKWSQARLGEEAGMDGSYIGEVERGEKHITVKRLNDVAKALKQRTCVFLVEGAWRKTTEEIERGLRVR